MTPRIQQLTRELKRQAVEAKTEFGGLSPEQLNWKPAADQWSVAQCFDHLIKTHSTYFPLLNTLAAGKYSPTIWERISPLSGFFGKMLIRTLDPANQKKSKTTSKALPAESDIDPAIIAAYAKHQQALIEHLQQLPADLAPKSVIITSPLLGFVTYSLADCFTIFEMHGQRHIGQAKRVMAALPGLAEKI